MESNKMIFEIQTKEELKELIVESLNSILQNKQNIKEGDDEFLTRDEVCKLLKVDSTTLWRWTNKGKITAFGIGSKRLYKKQQIFSAIVPLNQLGDE